MDGENRMDHSDRHISTEKGTLLIMYHRGIRRTSAGILLDTYEYDLKQWYRESVHLDDMQKMDHIVNKLAGTAHRYIQN